MGDSEGASNVSGEALEPVNHARKRLKTTFAHNLRAAVSSCFDEETYSPHEWQWFVDKNGRELPRVCITISTDDRPLLNSKGITTIQTTQIQVLNMKPMFSVTYDHVAAEVQAAEGSAKLDRMAAEVGELLSNGIDVDAGGGEIRKLDVVIYPKVAV